MLDIVKILEEFWGMVRGKEGNLTRYSSVGLPVGFSVIYIWVEQMRAKEFGSSAITDIIVFS